MFRFPTHPPVCVIRREADLFLFLSNHIFNLFQLSVAEVELRAAAEEKDKLMNDVNYSSLQHDEAVTKARQERDEAIERKKVAEVGWICILIIYKV